MTFSSDIKKFSKKFDGTTDELIAGIEIALYTAVILDTPVDTGRLRGNWFSSINTPSRNSAEKTDVSGTKTISAVHSFIKSLKGGRVTFLTNNLPYASRIEYGYSNQAPQGMVRKNVKRFRRIVNEQAIKVRK